MHHCPAQRRKGKEFEFLVRRLTVKMTYAEYYEIYHCKKCKNETEEHKRPAVFGEVVFQKAYKYGAAAIVCGNQLTECPEHIVTQTRSHNERRNPQQSILSRGKFR